MLKYSREIFVMTIKYVRVNKGDNMKQINRIHIVGASGSGTTTLASELSKVAGYKHLDTDNYFWEDTDPKFQEKRPVEKRLRLLNDEFKKYDRWILSGSLCGWGDVLIPKFDLVIFLKLPQNVRLERLLRREKERYGDEIEKGNSWYENHLVFMDWAAQYDNGDENVRSLELHNKWLKTVKCDVLRIEEVMEIQDKLELVLNYIDRNES